MITLRRSGERHHDRRRKHEVWLTFDAKDRNDPLADGYGALQMLDEDRLSPSAELSRRSDAVGDAEIVTYVFSGALAYDDSTGRAGVIQAGEFRRAGAGRGRRQRATNASRSEWAHVFQIWLRPAQTAVDPGHEQKRFSTAERRGELCLVASPDARRGSLRLNQDALLYSAVIEPGRHIVHALAQRRSAWLHVVQGEATLGDVVLTSGDGVGITAERAVSLTARAETEILLLDLAARA
jgi:redox-sensitive bicupin YhaK (pirin superfamily)